MFLGEVEIFNGNWWVSYSPALPIVDCKRIINDLDEDFWVGWIAYNMVICD